MIRLTLNSGKTHSLGLQVRMLPDARPTLLYYLHLRYQQYSERGDHGSAVIGSNVISDCDCQWHHLLNTNCKLLAAGTQTSGVVQLPNHLNLRVTFRHTCHAAPPRTSCMSAPSVCLHSRLRASTRSPMTSMSPLPTLNSPNVIDYF